MKKTAWMLGHSLLPYKLIVSAIYSNLNYFFTKCTSFLLNVLGTFTVLGPWKMALCITEGMFSPKIIFKWLLLSSKIYPWFLHYSVSRVATKNKITEITNTKTNWQIEPKIKNWTENNNTDFLTKSVRVY